MKIFDNTGSGGGGGDTNYIEALKIGDVLISGRSDLLTNTNYRVRGLVDQKIFNTEYPEAYDVLKKQLPSRLINRDFTYPDTDIPWPASNSTKNYIWSNATKILSIYDFSYTESTKTTLNLSSSIVTSDYLKCSVNDNNIFIYNCKTTANSTIWIFNLTGTLVKTVTVNYATQNAYINNILCYDNIIYVLMAYPNAISFGGATDVILKFDSISQIDIVGNIDEDVLLVGAADGGIAYAFDNRSYTSSVVDINKMIIMKDYGFFIGDTISQYSIVRVKLDGAGNLERLTNTFDFGSPASYKVAYYKNKGFFLKDTLASGVGLMAYFYGEGLTENKLINTGENRIIATNFEDDIIVLSGNISSNILKYYKVTSTTTETNIAFPNIFSNTTLAGGKNMTFSNITELGSSMFTSQNTARGFGLKQSFMTRTNNIRLEDSIEYNFNYKYFNVKYQEQNTPTWFLVSAYQQSTGESNFSLISNSNYIIDRVYTKLKNEVL